MMHAEVMARDLTVRSIAGALFEEAAHHLVCWRRGHDPLLCNGVKMCTRCYRTLRL